MSRDRQNSSALVNLRTMVIIAVSLIIGIGAGSLAYWYLSPGNPAGAAAGAAIAAVAAFAGSIKFLNDIVATDDDHTIK
jgi:membrane protein YdbS with pleckstrin-like domain